MWKTSIGWVETGACRWTLQLICISYIDAWILLCWHDVEAYVTRIPERLPQERIIFDANFTSLTVKRANIVSVPPIPCERANTLCRHHQSDVYLYVIFCMPRYPNFFPEYAEIDVSASSTRVTTRNNFQIRSFLYLVCRQRLLTNCSFEWTIWDQSLLPDTCQLSKHYIACTQFYMYTRLSFIYSLMRNLILQILKNIHRLITSRGYYLFPRSIFIVLMCFENKSCMIFWLERTPILQRTSWSKNTKIKHPARHPVQNSRTSSKHFKHT